MKILLDMNASPEWAEPIQEAGFAGFHWSEIGDPKAADAFIFQWAAQNAFVIYTHDLDFGAILAATNARFPSVIQIRTQNLFPDDAESVRRITNYLHQYLDFLTAGALVSIDEATARIRVLPIRSA